jgi:RHS repeat-associated protein
LWRQYFSRGQISFTAGVGTNYFYNLDHLGSVREITDSSGNIISQTTYDPYGIPTRLQGIIFSDFGYAGMYQHQRSGLNLTRLRGYSAVLGRWLNRDPIGEVGGINLYAYASNDPVNLIDPSGAAPLVASPISGLRPCGGGRSPRRSNPVESDSSDYDIKIPSLYPGRTLQTGSTSSMPGGIVGIRSIGLPLPIHKESEKESECEKRASARYNARAAQCGKNYEFDLTERGAATAARNLDLCMKRAFETYNKDRENCRGEE